MIEKAIPINQALSEEEMKVYVTKGYNKEYKNGKEIINNVFEVYDKVGNGSFWSVRKVKRNLISNGVLVDNNFYALKKGMLNKRNYILGETETENNETRIGVKEYNILKTICNVNIPRLYECIIDEKQNKIAFVMEFCDLGAMMILNVNEEGEESYVYNKNVIEFLWKKYRNDNSNEELMSPSQISYDKHGDFLECSAIEIFIQLSKALEYLHNKKLVAHLDIKPENVLFKTEEENYVKLSDFSISKKLPSAGVKVNVFGGTPAYEAPEKETGDVVDPFKCDIYSLGGTIFSFLFNSFEFRNSEEKLSLVKNTKLKLGIEACLESDPSKRVGISELIEIIS